MADGDILRLSEVSVRFGGIVALSDVSFSVRRHSITALIGPNGAGKTTCFNAISGTQRVSAGRVEFEGRNITGWQPHRRAGMGRTFQIVQLFGEMTVRENVLVGLHPELHGGLIATGLRLPFVKAQERRAVEKADELLGRVGLAHLAGRPARTLPLGQQRLLELARGLAAEPRLMLLDESASGLSPSELGELVRQVRLLHEAGVTVFLVEHNMRFVNRLAQHLVVLNYGSVLFDGPLEDGVKDPAVISAYLGTELANA